MTQALPQAGLKWMQEKPTAEDTRAWSNNEQYGAILEVNLEYPEELHDAHTDLPLCFQKRTAAGGGEIT